MAQSDYQDIFMPRGIQISPTSTPGYKPYNNVNLNPFMGGGTLPFGIGSILTQIFGPKMWPLMNPNSQASLYDATWQRNRDIQSMNLASDTVSSWYPFKNLGGLNKDSVVTQMATRLMSDPDGIVANAMSPVLGGNPIAAQMSSFANLQGMGSSALGTGRGVSVGQLNDALEHFNKYYYNQGTSSGGGTELSAKTLRTMEEGTTKALKNTAGDVAKAYSPMTKNAIDSAIRGMNFSNNLGLSVNTLLTARDAMITNRLFTPIPGISNLNKLSELAGGAEGGRLPSLIAASKGLWGNGISDKELMQNMNDFVGTSSFDVFKSKDTDKLENLIREFKSTARESNLDLNLMLGVASQAKGIAAQTPSLKDLGGEDIARMVMDMAQQTSVLATSTSPDNNWILRSQGGTQGLFAKKVQNTMDAASNPTIGMAAGVRTYIKEKMGENTVAGKAMLDKYDTWASGSSSFPMSQYGLMGWMQNNFAGTSMSADKAFQYSYNNPTAAAVAYEDNPRLLSQVTNGMQMGQIRLKIQARLGQPGLDLFDKYIKSNSLKEMELDPYLNQDSAGGPNSVSAIIHQGVDSGVFAQATINADPVLRANRDVEHAAIASGAKMEKEIDKRMGNIRPEALTRLVQSFTSGDYSKDGAIKPFLAAIGVSPTGQNLQAMSEMASNLNKLNGAKTIGDVAADMGWKNINDISGIATKYGLTGEQLRAVAASGDLSALQPSQIPKSDTDKNSILDAARNFTHTTDFAGYNGKLDVDSVKTFAKGKLTKDSLEKVWKSLGAEDNLRDLANTELDKMYNATDKPGSPDTSTNRKQLVDAVRKLSSDGKGGEDYLKGLSTLTHASTDTIVKGDDGKYSLPESMKSFVNSFKNADGSFKEGELSPEIISQLNQGGKDYTYDENTASTLDTSLQGLITKNDALKNLDDVAGTVQAGHDSLLGNADSNKDMPSLLGDILKKMDDLGGIAGAIRDLNSTLGGTAN